MNERIRLGKSNSDKLIDVRPTIDIRRIKEEAISMHRKMWDKSIPENEIWV